MNILHELSGFLGRLCLLLVLCMGSAYAGDRGLAWEVTKAGQKAYLLGSVHFADASFYPLPGPIMAAYNASKKLVVEVDETQVLPERRQALLARFGQYPEGTSIYDTLTPNVIDQIASLLAEFEVPVEAVKTYRPGLIAITLTGLQAGKLGYSPDQGLDRYFMQKARYKKPIEQIETFESQMALLAQLPEDGEVLANSFENMEDYASQWTATMDAWKEGDAKALYDTTIGAALSDFPEMEPYFEVLFFGRHPKMLAVVERCISNDEACFVVVGAGHMVGSKGLLRLLRERDYSVRQL